MTGFYEATELAAIQREADEKHTRDLIGKLFKALDSRQWEVRNAAENYYCRECETSDDRYSDQNGHNSGCPLIALLEDAKKWLREHD